VARGPDVMAALPVWVGRRGFEAEERWASVFFRQSFRSPRLVLGNVDSLPPRPEGDADATAKALGLAEESLGERALRLRGDAFTQSAL